MLAQVSINPTVTPTLSNGGWVWGAALLLFGLAVVFTLVVLFGYMRLAPRFQTDEETRKSVRVPRMQPGKEVRRPVNVTGAPLIVQPPVVALASAVAAPSPGAVASSASATLAAPAAAPPPAAAPASASAALAAPSAGPTAPEAAPANPAAVSAPAPVTPVPTAPAAAEHREVTLDQETFDRVLAELLDKGTDRRVAEGQARRAAMIAARKKAEG